MRPRGYGQFCPVAKAAEILAERWTPLLLRELLAGSRRFNELRRGVPLMSPTLLSSRLERLERAGIVRRIRAPDQRRWEYHLTEAGAECRPLIELMGAWGQRWAIGRITREDLDPALVMWFLLRRAEGQTERLPADRVVVMIDLADGGTGKRYWWLVLARPEVDLCLADPGFAVDVTVRSNVRTIAMLLLGTMALDRARRSGKLTIEGPGRLGRSVPAWLGLAETLQPG